MELSILYVWSFERSEKRGLEFNPPNPTPNNVNLQNVLSFQMFWFVPKFSNHFLETKTNLIALGFLGGLVNQSI